MKMLWFISAHWCSQKIIGSRLALWLSNTPWFKYYKIVQCSRNPICWATLHGACATNLGLVCQIALSESGLSHHGWNFLLSTFSEPSRSQLWWCSSTSLYTAAPLLYTAAIKTAAHLLYTAAPLLYTEAHLCCTLLHLWTCTLFNTADYWTNKSLAGGVGRVIERVMAIQAL